MKKLSLKNAENMLTRKEMKNIMAGSGSTCYPSGIPYCITSAECTNRNCNYCYDYKCVHRG